MADIQVINGNMAAAIGAALCRPAVPCDFLFAARLAVGLAIILFGDSLLFHNYSTFPPGSAVRGQQAQSSFSKASRSPLR